MKTFKDFLIAILILINENFDMILNIVLVITISTTICSVVWLEYIEAHYEYAQIFQVEPTQWRVIQ